MIRIAPKEYGHWSLPKRGLPPQYQFNQTDTGLFGRACPPLMKLISDALNSTSSWGRVLAPVCLTLIDWPQFSISKGSITGGFAGRSYGLIRDPSGGLFRLTRHEDDKFALQRAA